MEDLANWGAHEIITTVTGGGGATIVTLAVGYARKIQARLQTIEKNQESVEQLRRTDEDVTQEIADLREEIVKLKENSVDNVSVQSSIGPVLETVSGLRTQIEQSHKQDVNVSARIEKHERESIDRDKELKNEVTKLEGKIDTLTTSVNNIASVVTRVETSLQYIDPSRTSPPGHVNRPSPAAGGMSDF